MYYGITDFVHSGTTSKSKRTLLKKVYDEIIEEINFVAIVDEFPSLSIVNNTYLDDGTIANYGFGIISVSTKIITNKQIEELKEALVHEIGHHIHKTYFNDEFISFPEDQKSQYAYTNHYEDFAECFTDLFYYHKNNKRTEEMEKTLGYIN